MKSTLKKRKQFILDPIKIKTVRTILKARTDTEAVVRALDEIIENSRLEKTLLSIKGKGRIVDVYGRVSS